VAAGVLLQAPYTAIGWGLLSAAGLTIAANPADAMREE